METHQPRRFRAARLVGGINLILIGTLFMLDRAGFLDGDTFWKYWPLLLIATGLAQLMQPPREEGEREGLWLVIIGAWFLSNSLTALRFSNSWPLLLVALGGHIVWKALSPRSIPPRREQ